MNFDLALTRRAQCVDPPAVPCRAMMHKRAVVVAGVALALGVTACGSSGSSKGSSASSNPKAPETKNPPGDIPDTQAYVRYTVPASGFSVKVPEGRSQQRSGGAVVFTDKLNTIRLESRPASAALTVAAARRTEVAQLQRTVKGFQPGTVSQVARTAGPAVRITYFAQAPVNPVTGKSGTDAVERYVFFHRGRNAVVTVSGPKGADNVDPWRLVTDSLRWSR